MSGPGPNERLRTILLLGGNSSRRRLLAGMVCRLGHRVVEGVDLKSAVVQLQEARTSVDGVDLVLVDGLCDGEDGLAVVTALREQGERAPLVILSTSPSALDQRRLRREGVVGFEGHSCGPRRLAEVISAALDRPRGDAGGGRPWALVVDDSEVNRMVARSVLHELGLSVDEAVHGGEAVEAVRRRDYAVVFMDCEMPVMNGFEATGAIRRVPGRGAVPIIAMTGSCEAFNRERCLEAGMDDFTVKPLDAGELSRVLGLYLDRVADGS